jgi:hypothetical protein
MKCLPNQLGFAKDDLYFCFTLVKIRTAEVKERRIDLVKEIIPEEKVESGQCSKVSDHSYSTMN